MSEQNYVIHRKEALAFDKHGAGLTVYPMRKVATANVVHVSVKHGHFQEFYDNKSTYIYYVEDGEGVFMLNGEAHPVKRGDVVEVEPMTRIHYFGALEMVLTVTPPFNEANERHVRFVEESESPYYQKVE